MTTPSPPVSPYRVVVVDDHAMFRTGVKAEIGSAVQVVGEAADADRAIAVVLQTQPDVVLLDVHLPGGGGIEVLRKVHEKIPDQKFLAIPAKSPISAATIANGAAKSEWNGAGST